VLRARSALLAPVCALLRALFARARAAVLNFF
jgi:hypothetical protein